MDRKFLSKLCTLVTIAGALAATPLQAQDEGPSRQESRREIAFIRQLIQAHRGVLLLSQDCDQRTDDTVIIDYCHNQESTSQGDIDTLKSFLTTWYGEEEAVRADRTNSGRRNRGVGRNNGDRFDAAYLKALLKADERLLAILRRSESKSAHDELLAYSENLSADLVQEISEIEAMLEDESIVGTSGQRGRRNNGGGDDAPPEPAP